MPVSLRRSDVETFLECRQKWQYSSPGGNDLEFPALNKATFLGSAVHYALSQFYKPRPAGSIVPDPKQVLTTWGLGTMANAMAEGWEVDTEALTEALVLGKVMLSGYVEQWGFYPDDVDNLRFLGTEIPFEVEIPGTDGGMLSGTADGLCQDMDTGQYLIFETKTYTTAPPRNHYMNFQTLAYVWAFNEMAQHGHPLFEHATDAMVVGSIYNGLRKQEPGPRVTKALFVRERVLRSRPELARFAHHLRDIYFEMTNPNVAIYPTITRNCEWCAFADPCYAKLAGLNEEWLLESLYTKHVRGLAEP